jgi:hypothetical protein
MSADPAQVQQIDEHAGWKFEDLDEETIEAAMDDLGIEAEEPTDEEMAQLDAAE